MKKIKLSSYNPNMGILIDVRHPVDYMENHHPFSKNIHYEKLLYNHQKYLKKTEKYYITCSKGKLSKKVVTNLEYNGYNVTLVEI